MKKPFLYCVIVIFMAIPLVSWAITLSGFHSWPLFLHNLCRLFALLGIVLVLLQYAWISKIKWIERGAGAGFLFRLHRTNGYLILTLILLHPVILLLSERLLGYASPANLFKIIGFVTLLILFVASASAILNKRLRLKYRVWRGIHRANYLVFPLGFIHSLFLGSGLHYRGLRTFWYLLALIYLSLLAARLLKRKSGR